MKELDYESVTTVPAYIAVSNYCNLRCSYCYVPEEHKAQKDEIDRVALEFLYDLDKKARTERFALSHSYLHGAEPTTLSPDAFREAVNILSGITTAEKVGVQTNGVKLTERYHDEMGDLTDDLDIGFTLDLPLSVHDLNRQKTHKAVLKNMEVARDRGYNYRVLCGISSDTVERLEEVRETIELLHRTHPGMNIAFKPISGEKMMSVEQRVQWGDFLADTGLYDYDHSVWGNLCQIRGNDCFWLEFMPDGGVVSCNKVFDKSQSFANWREEPIRQIVARRRTLYITQEIPKDCIGCRYWLKCRGGCPVDRYIESREDTYENGTKHKYMTSVSLDCATRMRIYERMEQSGIDPLKEMVNLPKFPRQNNYRQWKQHGKDMGYV